VREEQKVCPKCGGRDFTRLGEGAATEIYELVAARVERQRHIQEKLRCRCGEAIITADGPARVYDKARFGLTFMAQIAVSKCADSLPLHRQAKAYRRVGVQVDDSTLGDLFRRTAEITRPLADRLLKLVAEKETCSPMRPPSASRRKARRARRGSGASSLATRRRRSSSRTSSRGAAPAKRRCRCSATHSASSL
jgi:transposase